MNPTYIIYLLTFLGFPFLGLLISPFLDFNRSKKYLKWILLVFATHNILFYFGLSIKGDYLDYFIFSLEYLFICITILILYKSETIYSKIFRYIGTVVIIVGFLQGLIGILLFIVISQDYETDRIYNFKSNGKNYQTRRYSFGFATLEDTRYTFKTYRTYKYLPFEKLINKTDFFDSKSDLDFRDGHFSIDIKESENKKTIEFSSTNGKQYKTTID
jgi:hypothetical protein